MNSPVSNPVKVKILSTHHIVILIIATMFAVSCVKQTPQITNPAPSNPPPLPPSSQTAVPGDSAAMIYIAAGNTNDIYALEANTGKLLWNKKVTGSYTSSTFYSSGLMVVEGFDINFPYS